MHVLFSNSFSSHPYSGLHVLNSVKLLRAFELRMSGRQQKCIDI